MFERVAFDFYAAGERLQRDRDLRWDVAFEAAIHQVKSCADGDGRDSDADEQRVLLANGSCAHQIAGFQVLRSCAGDRGGDAHDSTNHQSKHGVIGGGPTSNKENCAGSHQWGDAHAADGIRRVAQEAADATGDSYEEKTENYNENCGKQILLPMSDRAFDRLKGK